MKKKPSDEDLRWMNIAYANSDDPRSRSAYYQDVFGVIFFEGGWRYGNDIPTERQILEAVDLPDREEDEEPEVIIPPIPKPPVRKPTLNSAEYLYLAKRLAALETTLKTRRPKGDY